MQEEEKQVGLLYSTKPKRVLLHNREYRIPANHFSPKQRDEPDTLDAVKDGFGFYLFLPDFGGYTKENWREGWFDKRLIQVLRVKTVDRNAMVPMTDGTRRPIRPAGYGEPTARFKNLRSILEKTPSFQLYGLNGYRQRGVSETVTWTGTRSNGEFFFFDSTLPPGQEPRPHHHAFCQAQYYSAQRDLHVLYRYSQEHIAKWREIDDAIWGALDRWRVK